jgi:tetratricopeptide (TPR) repeat protein
MTRGDGRNSYGEIGGSGEVKTTSTITGAISGTAVQAGSIFGGVHVHEASVRTPVPRQLPPTASNFTNRAVEIARLDEISRERARGDHTYVGLSGLALLVGPGGVGKTALAVWWGAQNAERYGDGQLYADLRGFSLEGAASTEGVLGGFLRALGVPPERVPVELAEQASLYRSLTAGRRLFVLLDNALSVAQVRPLLPASEQSMVLVTSRRRLGGLHAEGAALVDVEPLPHEHAVDLLARSLGPARVDGQLEQVQKLVALCDRLPIALRVISARLAVRPRWSLDRVVSELSDERRRLATLSAGEEVSVRAAFDLSYQGLDEELARLYRLISVHPGPYLDAPLAAASAAVEVDDAFDGLEALVDASLLEEVDDDRYRFHDLVRLHGRAQGEASSEESDAAAKRIAEWFLSEVTRANLVVIPDRWRVSDVWRRHSVTPAVFATSAEAVEWLDGQLPNLLAVLADSARRGWHHLTWQLCEALWELFLHRKHYREWVSTHQLGITAAHRCGHVVAEARLRCQLARAHLELHEFEVAEQECRLALALARSANNRHNESVAIDQLGMAAQGRGDIDRAITCYRDSLRIEAELGIRRGVALRHRRIGDALYQAGRTAAAAVELERARTMFAAVSASKDEAKTLVTLARIDAGEGRCDVASRRLQEAMAVLRSSGSAVYQAEVLLASAEISQHQGDVAAARRHLVDALRLAEEPGGPLVERVQARLAALPPVEPD